jgi:hypothetical protein
MTNHLLSKCERWHEPISLLTAGCLSAQEEASVREHLANCAVCSTRFAEMTEVCACLNRSRPAAADHSAAIRNRWSQTADHMTQHQPAHRTPWIVYWLSGAMAASLLIAALLLTHLQHEDSLPAPKVSRIAVGGTKSPEDQASLRHDLPPTVNASDERVWSQPTLHACELAMAQSDEAFDTLLQRQGESIKFQPYHPRSLLKEFYP